MRMAGDNQPVFHFVNPIASVGNEAIMRDEEKGPFSFAHDLGKQLKSALRIVGVEVSGWFIGQDDLWIVGQGARNRHSLLFAAGKVTALAAKFIAQGHGI